MLNNTKLIFNRIDKGFIRVDREVVHNERKVYPTIATLSQNSWGRKLWQIDFKGGRYVDQNGCDCFTLTTAKQIIKNLTKSEEQENA